MIEFRTFEPQDDAACRAIAAEAAMTSYGRAMPELRHVFSPQTPLDAAEWRWVALVDGVVAAFIEMNGHHVENLFVAAHHQGKGLGRALLEQAEARTQGTITLTVFQANPRARSLYERQGYVVQESRTIRFHGVEQGTWFMSKTLAD